MTTTQLTPTPVFKGWDSNGRPLAFGLLYSYEAGTTTPTPTYTDSTGLTPNTNPIVLNARGEAPVWLNPTQGYKLNLTDSAGNQIPNWPVDNIIGPLNINQSLIPAADNTYDLGSTASAWRQLYLGANHSPALDTVSGIIGYYPQTPAEIAASVTPVSFAYVPGDVRRYGTNTTPGTTDMTAAFTNALAVCSQLVPSGANVNWGAVCATVTSSQKFAVTSVSIPSGCGLVCPDGVADIIALSSSVGAVLDTPVLNSGNTACFDTTLRNIYVHGPGATGTVCGLRLNNVQEPTLENVFFDNLPGPAVVVNSKADGTAYYYGVATSLTGTVSAQGIVALQVGAFNCLQNAAALTQRVGTFNVMGSDHDFYSCVSWNPVSRSLSSANKYAPAWALVGVNESRFVNSKGSVSDQGWHMDSNTTANFFTNVRADANLAEGMDIAGSLNWFENVDLNGNGTATDNTYDHLVFESTATRNYIVSGMASNNLGSTNSARYCVTDNNTVAGSPNRIGIGVLMKDASTGGVNNAGGVLSVTLADGAPQSFTSGATTPSVVNGNQPVRNWITSNSTATSITNFSNGFAGQVIYLESGDSNTTIVNGSSTIRTLTGSNITTGIFGPGHICGFKLNPSGYWQQFCG